MLPGRVRRLFEQRSHHARCRDDRTPVLPFVQLQADRIDRTHGDSFTERLRVADETRNLCPQLTRERLRERRQQHARLRILLREMHSAVERDDRLARSGRTRDARRPVVGSLDDLPLSGMEEHHPLLPWKLQGLLQFLDIRDQSETTLRIRMLERIGARFRRRRDDRRRAGRELQ